MKIINSKLRTLTIPLIPLLVIISSPAHAENSAYLQCRQSGYTHYQCNGQTAAYVKCRQSGYTHYRCNGQTIAYVKCRRSGYTHYQCNGQTAAYVKCRQSGYIHYRCNGQTIAYVKCRQSGYTHYRCSNTVNSSPKKIEKKSRKPYCSVASNSGANWHYWGTSSQDVACSKALFKVLEFGQSVDKAWKGYYSSGPNKANLSCNQGSKIVYGYNSEVFKKAMQMKRKLVWNGCIIRII